MRIQISQEAIEHPVFKVIQMASEKLGYKSFVIGGFVRDFLLNKENGKDIDIVTNGSGPNLALEVSKNLEGAPNVNIFKQFGTAHIAWDNIELEFVGARKESYRLDSRKPIVENGTIEDDQRRRDFTINALAISLNPKNFGTLIDPFGGISHLQEKILTTPLEPDQTFSDDPLRMMRAIRFAGQLGFTISPSTYSSISNNAHRIKIVSKERIIDEFNKIMRQGKPSIGLRLLKDCGLLIHFLPELVALQGVQEIEGKTHKDNFYHTIEVVDNISEQTDSLWLRWAALFHDIGKAPTKKFNPDNGWSFHGHEHLGGKMAEKIFKRLKLPLGATVNYVQKIIQLSSRPIALVSEEATDSAVRRLIYDAGESIDDLMTLCEADITTKNLSRKKKFKDNFKKLRQRFKEIEDRDRIRNWQPPISGKVIMQTFQLKPSKTVGELKIAIREAILEGEISNNYEEAYAFLLKKGAELGLKPS